MSNEIRTLGVPLETRKTGPNVFALVVSGVPGEGAPSAEAGSVAVVPSDVTVYDPPLHALFVGTLGAVTIVGPNGAAATFVCPSGSWLEPGYRIHKVMATGTDAENLVGVIE